MDFPAVVRTETGTTITLKGPDEYTRAAHGAEKAHQCLFWGAADDGGVRLNTVLPGRPLVFATRAGEDVVRMHQSSRVTEINGQTVFDPDQFTGDEDEEADEDE